MINWGALLLVAGVSLAVSVVIVSLVSFALVGFSSREGDPDAQRVLSPAAGTAAGVVCIAAVVLIVLYGLWIVSKDAILAIF